MPKTYLCDNPVCTLGAVGQPGRFTGGITKDQVTLLTGNPDPEDHGEGVCPNCGTKSTREAPTAAQEERAHLESELARLKTALKEVS